MKDRNATTLPAPDNAELPVPVKHLPAKLDNAVTIGGIRFDLFNRGTNGLEESGALVFRGRRILIYPSRYLRWMETRPLARNR